MAHRNIHYEAAFEDYLRAKGVPYVAVDETKKALFAEVAMKSFDFLVYSESGPNLLVDVKGRKFPDSLPGQRRGAGRVWENWITQADSDSLAEWQRVFGDGFRAVLVFAYWLQGPPQRAPFADVHLYRQRHYAFLCVAMPDYLAAAKQRSAKWQTLSVPSRRFAELARDLTSLL